MADTFHSLFLLVLLAATSVRILLAVRQMRHVNTHRHSVPARFAATIPLAAHQKAADYTLARSRFGLVSLAMDTAVLLLLTVDGGLSALHTFWSVHSDGLGYGLLLIGSVFLLTALADLPLSIWRQFVIERRFGFNRMTPALFISDLGKGMLLAILIGAPLLAAVLWLMESMGKHWWLWVWLFWCAFNLLALFVYPTWIAPLFNKFTPMPEGALKSRIEALLSRCGFTSGGLFVMDGSKRSAHGNAYFTGFGRNKRIVFFDTLLERLSPAEIEAVLAHELGHFHHRHVAQRIALSFAASLALLYLLGILIEAPWFYQGLGVTGQSTALALVLFMLVLPLFTFFITPCTSLLSRHNEYEADRYAALHASAADLISALIRLYEDNAATLTPDPLHSLFYDSHPPATLRIRELEAQR